MQAVYHPVKIFVKKKTSARLVCRLLLLLLLQKYFMHMSESLQVNGPTLGKLIKKTIEKDLINERSSVVPRALDATERELRGMNEVCCGTSESQISHHTDPPEHQTRHYRFKNLKKYFKKGKQNELFDICTQGLMTLIDGT